MMVNEHAVNEHALEKALLPRDEWDGERPAHGARAAEVEARLHAAERLLPDDPDAAALLLDGLLQEIRWLWRAQADLSPPAPALQPALVERDDRLFGWRLRLALRAPDVRARLAHCAALYALLPARAVAADKSA